MVVHEPEGQTITSASLNIRRNRSAQGRASSQKPELNAGWPQQVWSAGKSTSHPMRRRTFTVSTATSGCSWSTKHGTKSEILRAILNWRDFSRIALRNSGQAKVRRPLFELKHSHLILRGTTHARNQ